MSVIFKSKGRKEHSAESLYNYIMRDAGKQHIEQFLFNIYGQTKEDIIREFKEQNKLVAKRKGCNHLYHEIISLGDLSHLPEEMQKRIFYDVIEKYISLRGEHLLCFSALHLDQKNAHAHLMLSANNINCTKRISLSKKQFKEIQRITEEYALQQYPQLHQDRVHNQKEKSMNPSDKEYHMRKRTPGRILKKDSIRHTVQDLLEFSLTLEEFTTGASAMGLEVYQRGKTTGVVDVKTSKRHRLKTLNPEFPSLYDAIASCEQSISHPTNRSKNSRRSQSQKTVKKKQITKDSTNKKETQSKSQSVQRERKTKKQPQEKEMSGTEYDGTILGRLFKVFADNVTKKGANRVVDIANSALPHDAVMDGKSENVKTNIPYPEVETDLDSLFEAWRQRQDVEMNTANIDRSDLTYDIDYKNEFKKANKSLFEDINASQVTHMRMEEYWENIDRKIELWKKERGMDGLEM